MNRSILRVVPALAAGLLMIPAALGTSGAASEGKPLLPDLDQESPTQLVITKVSKPGRSSWRLGFASAVRNIGAGPLIVDGRRPSPGQRTMGAVQVIVNDGSPRSVIENAGRLRYVRSPDHQHWHLLGFDRYELRRPGSTDSLVRDRKSGFCLGDRYAVTTHELLAKPPDPVYTSRCGIERPGLLGIREGISVGYGDDYAANLEGQYLPLDGLRPGRYTLVHRVNADRRLMESSYENNASSALLRLRRRGGVPRIRILAVCAATEQCAPAR